MLVVTTMALVAALLIDSGYRSYRQAQEQAAQAAQGLAQVTADSVESFLADTRLTMSKLAARPAIRLMDPEHCDSVFREFRDLYPQFANFSQANMDGELVCSTLPQPGDRYTVIRDTEWFRSVVQKQVFVVAPPYVGPVSGKAVSVLAHPVRDASGRMIGSIQLPVDLTAFKPVVGSSRLPPSTIITVIDSAGTIVARSQSPEHFVGNRPGSPIIAQVLAQRSGTSRSFSSEGIERVYGFLPIAGTDWYAVAGIATDAVFSEAKKAALRNAILGLAIIVFAFGIALYLRRQIVTPVMALRDTAQRVAGGALDARAAAGGPAEIAEVAAQFNAMLDARAAQIAALADSEADLRMLFESSVEAILRTLPDGTILRANPAACGMLGIAEAQLQENGREENFDVSDPRWTRLIEERARTGQARGELTMIRADGSRFECAISSSLYTAADGVVRTNVFLRDLTDRMQKEELRAGKEAADLANREKSAFLARMSHELRTPLNAILGFSQLLEHDRSIMSSDKAKMMIGHVRTAGRHLLALIDEVLDLSRIEAGALALSPEQIDIGRLIEDCMALTASLSERCKVEVQYECGDSAGWIWADQTRVRQVLINVLTNAIKYNRAGGSVQLRLGGDAECLEISVQDTGAGLSAKQIANLFQPFNRLGAERSGVEGTGLGLVIVKQLMQAMQANIDVVSAPGQGSTFTLRFPRGEPADVI